MHVLIDFALMLGTYAQYNLSAEPEWARFVNELNVGIKLSKTKNIWLDAGVLPSHIGFESAVGADCWTLTRSILAENSPYYETGLKLTSISKNEKLTASFLVLNGWQCIQKPAWISRPSFGGKLTYKPSGKLVLNYSNFSGFAQADSLNAFRLFHNIYGTYDITNKLGITMGLDFGMDKYNPSNYGFWYSPVVIAKYSFNERNRLAFRAEYYNDEKQIIIPTNTPNGFQVIGTSLNYDYKLANSVWWRTEMKYYSSLDKIFTDSKGLTNMNIGFTTALTVKF